MFLQANLPPIELYVKKEYLYDLEKGHGELVDGLWVSVKSIQGRALYFETYLPEYGAVYDKLPLSAFVWKKDYEGEIKLEELELWDDLQEMSPYKLKSMLKSERWSEEQKKTISSYLDKTENPRISLKKL